ncbi:MAG: hypothetical protein RSB41_00300 [Bacilli bacterium]
MKKFFKSFGIFLSVILSMILVCLIISFVILINTNKFLTPEFITSSVNNIDIKEIVKTNNELKFVYDEALKYEIKPEVVDEVLSSSKLKENIAKRLYSKIDNINIENTSNQIKKEDLLKLTDEVINDINKNEIKVSVYERSQITNLINDNSDTIIKYIDKTDKSSISLEPSTLQKLYKLFGSNIQIILILIVLAVILLIALFTLSIYKWMYYVGVASISSGTILTIFGISSSSIVNLFDKELSTSWLSAIDSFMHPLGEHFIILGLILLGIGFALMLGAIIIDHIISKNEKAYINKDFLETPTHKKNELTFEKDIALEQKIEQIQKKKKTRKSK